MKPLFLPAVLALAGCAAPYQRVESADPALDRALFECRSQAVSMYPVVKPPPSQPNQLNCTTYGNQTNCQAGRSGIDFSQLAPDTNIAPRIQFVDACMASKGYRR